MNRDEKREIFLQQIINKLSSAEALERLAGLQQLGKTYVMINHAVCTLVEQLAIQDNNTDVQALALKTLALSSFQNYQSTQVKDLSRQRRRTLIREISRWEVEGLISEGLAGVLRQRYAFGIQNSLPHTTVSQQPPAVQPSVPSATSRTTTEPAPKAAEPRLQPQPAVTPAVALKKPVARVSAPIKPKAPRRSLGEVLLSEASIKITLYLGAFLFLAAAFIFAGLFEALRIPILSTLTILSLGSAIAFKKRIPLASLVMFIIYSFLILINGQVVATISGLSAAALPIYWMFITVILILSWGGGTLLYESSLFSVLTFLAIQALFLQIGWWLDLNAAVIHALMIATNLTALYGIYKLSQWKDAEFTTPLFIAVQTMQALFILSSFQIFSAMGSGSGWWWFVSISWLFSGLFYFLSDAIRKNRLFPLLTATMLTPVIWFTMAAFEGENTAVWAVISWVWGAGHMVSAEWVREHKQARLARFSPPFFFSGSLLLFVGAMMATSSGKPWLAGGVWFSSSVLYFVLYLRKTRKAFWYATLGSLLIAYFNIYLSEGIQASDFFGYVLLWPTLFYLGLDWAICRLKLFENNEHRLPRVMGRVLGVAALFSLIGIDTLHTRMGLAVLGLFLMGYAWGIKKTRLAYLGTAVLAISVASFSTSFTNLILLLNILASIYVVGGAALLLLRRFEDWGLVFGLSGATLMGLTTFLGLFTGTEDVVIVLITALLSMLYFVSLELILSRRDSENIKLEHLFVQIGMTFATLQSLVFFLQADAGYAAVSLFLLAAIYGFYSVLRNTPQLAYVGTAAFSASLAYTVNYYQGAQWVPIMITLAGVYFLIGALPLFWKVYNGWTNLFRTSGLILMGVISWVSLALENEIVGLNITALALVLFLTSEVFLTRLVEREPEDTDFQIQFSQIGGGWMTLQFFVLLWSDVHSGYDSFITLLVAVVYLAYAILLNRPQAGYLATFTFTVSATYLLDHYQIDWPIALMSLSLAYFVGGSVALLRQQNNKWSDMLRTSGLILAVVLSWIALGTKPTAWGIDFSVIALALLITSEILLKEFDATVRENGWQILLAQAGGGLMSVQILFALLYDPTINSVHATIILALLGWMYLTYSVLVDRPFMGYAATIVWGFAGLAFMDYLNVDNVLPILMVLSASYYVIGVVLFSQKNLDRWAEVFRNSAIALGIVTAVMAPMQNDASSVFAFALIATLSVAEAYRLKTLWPVILANFFYLGAYIQALVILDVENPQFYSTGAAVMGLVMHYLLLRMKANRWAFYIGLLSQLMLLSITYYQMATIGRLSFFIVLFFQALVVFAYGLIMHSRSLVFTPVAFIILGVVTVLYSSLAGYATLIIIGTTGLLLLIGGIGALILREQIQEIGENLNHRMEDWQP